MSEARLRKIEALRLATETTANAATTTTTTTTTTTSAMTAATAATGEDDISERAEEAFEDAFEDVFEDIRTRKRPRRRQQGVIPKASIYTTSMTSFDDFRASLNATTSMTMPVTASVTTNTSTSTSTSTTTTTTTTTSVTTPETQQTIIPPSLFFDALLEREPYWVKRARLDATTPAAATTIAPELPSLTPDYCRRYRREPWGQRRACLLADRRQCVGQLYMSSRAEEGFAYMELLMPDEEDVFLRTGALPVERQMCEMCVRYFVSYQVLACRRRMHVAPVTLNSYMHVCDLPGGYRKSACIQQVPGHSNGLLGLFRHFDVSEYVSVTETVQGNIQVRGHDEVADVFFD
jgi:hypothetical protein